MTLRTNFGLKYVPTTYLVSLHMTRNDIGSFDVKKPRTLTKPLIEFLFLIFCAKNGPNNVEFRMYKVTK